MAQYTETFGCRMSREDREKLADLCDKTQRGPGEIIRLLVRLAQPSNVPAVTLGSMTSEQELAGD